MLRPTLPAWVKERHQTICLRIAGMCPPGFEVVTAARKREIIQFSLAPPTVWEDVIYLKCKRRKRSRTEAVFATLARAFFDQLPLFPGRRFSGHCDSDPA